jgi:hypothetical protein
VKHLKNARHHLGIRWPAEVHPVDEARSGEGEIGKSKKSLHSYLANSYPSIIRRFVSPSSIDLIFIGEVPV